MCVGTVDRGDWNNCGGSAEYAVVTTNGSRLCVLGACERHVLRAKFWMAENVADFGEVLITTPDALEETLNADERANMFRVIPPEAVNA